MTIPKIDPNVRHVGVSYLRKLNASQLRQLDGAIVICDNSEPLAVIVSYETFLRIQQAQVVLSDGVEKAIGKIDEFDARRQEIQARIKQGARRTSGKIK